jgi:uncharacterized protein YkwD
MAAMRQPTVVASVIALALAAGPSPASAQAPDPLLAPAGTCAADADRRAHHRLQRLAMHCLVNHARSAAGLPLLRSSVVLRHSATYKARRIADCRRFSHRPCGDPFAAAFRQARLADRRPWRVGEDLGYGVGRRSTPRYILTRWLASGSHRRVLLNPSMTHIGVRRRRLALRGARRGSVIWVAHVGTPLR